MFLQIAIGTGLMMLSLAVGGLGILVMEMGFSRFHFWLIREPHRPKLLLVMLGVSFVVLGIITAGVWIWAIAFYALGVFITLEASVYFSLVSFTTLGFGDILLPQEWRLLSGMAAANGLLNFGLLTALLVEALRHVRLGQMKARNQQE